MYIARELDLIAGEVYLVYLDDIPAIRKTCIHVYTYVHQVSTC